MSLVIIVLVLLLLKRDIGLKQREMAKARRIMGFATLPLVGLYSSIVGGGSAIIMSFVLVLCFGETYLQSAGTRKPASAVKHLIVAIIYGIYGFIVWVVAFPLLIGNLAGAWVGSHYAIRKGDRFVRTLFIIVTFVAALKLVI